MHWISWALSIDHVAEEEINFKLFFVSFAVFRLGEGLAGALEHEHDDWVEMLPLAKMASMQTAQSEVLEFLQKFKVSSHVYKI